MARILVVDDEEDILTVVTVALESEGHEVRGTQDPLQVPLVLNDERVDAMVLDQMMPGKSGLEVLEWLRDQPGFHHLPVLMLSARGEAEERVKGLKAGADDYLAKPFHADELVVRLRNLLRERQPAEIAGRLESLSPGQLLRGLLQDRRCGVVTITGQGRPVFVEVAAGSLMTARYGLLDGFEALTAIAALDSGAFRFDPYGDKPVGLAVPAPSLHLDRILLEAAWLEDELASRDVYEPMAGETLEAVVTDPPELTGELVELPAEQVLSCLRAEPGLGIDDLLARQLMAPARLRLTLAVLVELDAIRPLPRTLASRTGG